MVEWVVPNSRFDAVADKACEYGNYLPSFMYIPVLK